MRVRICFTFLFAVTAVMAQGYLRSVMQSKTPCAVYIDSINVNYISNGMDIATINSYPLAVGNHIIRLQCTYNGQPGAARVSIWIDNISLDYGQFWSSIWYSVPSQTLSCINAWTSSENSYFFSAGGSSYTTSIWPCSWTSSIDLIRFFYVSRDPISSNNTSTAKTVFSATISRSSNFALSPLSTSASASLATESTSLVISSLMTHGAPSLTNSRYISSIPMSIPLGSLSRSPTVTRSSTSSLIFSKAVALHNVNDPTLSQISTQKKGLSSAAVASVDPVRTSAHSFIQFSAKFPLYVYAIFGGLVLFIIILFAVAAKSRIGQRKTRRLLDTTKSSEVSGSASNDLTSFSDFTSNSMSSELTIANLDAGLYLPGNMAVDTRTAYRTEREIARGGNGSIWTALAMDSKLTAFGKIVIVKVPTADIASPRLHGLFRQEIALMNAFKTHPNIVRLLGYSENPYAVILKYYPKGSVSTWISSEKRQLSQVLSFLRDIAAGISALHNSGVAHCDLKPDNVFIDEGSRLVAVIGDFGIARIVSDQLLQVAAYHVVEVTGASISFAAPEALVELRRKNVVPLSPVEILSRDLYSISMVISALLRGRNTWY
eukprot:Partr_v1_DN26531_c2_g2_i2_m3337 putative protein kinase kinase kinase